MWMRMIPVMIYDGECQFCSHCIALLKRVSGDSIDYRPSSEAAADHPEIPLTAFEEAVQFIRPNGTRASAAEAILEALAPFHPAAKWVHSWHSRSLIIRSIFECGYKFVAENRQLFSSLTTACSCHPQLELGKMHRVPELDQ